MKNLRNNRTAILVSCIIILLPVAAGLLLWNRLPDRIATHFDFHGTADDWSSRGFTVFALPLFLLAVQMICAFATSFDPGNTRQSGKILNVVIWMVPVISTAVMASLYAKALGASVSVSDVMLGMSGLLFLILGNYMPKARQNGTIGIRVPWTLKDEEVWNRTHRLGGKTFMTGGLILLACIFLPDPWKIAGLILAVMTAGIVPMFYSWMIWQRRHRAH